MQVYPPGGEADGPCALKAVNIFPEDVDAVGQNLVLQSTELGLPMGTSGDVETGQVVIITSSEFDAASVGTEFRIEGLAERQTYATLRRFRIEERS
ncbi:MAG: hypothetical protein BGO91_13745 [Leifsonia sp. 71-9]|nr:MAG: hypothetical protein BGO91_13745 [Leifsonia sp. 71-9]